MNEDLNIIQSINEGADDSINSKPTIDIVGGFNSGVSDWQSIFDSSVNNFDQVNFDNVLYNNLDLISNYRLFERLKNYEHGFGYSSDDFYKKWIEGKLEPRKEFYDWATVYKNLLIHP